MTNYSNTMRIWQLDRPNRKIRPTEVNMGQVKRVVRCLQVNNKYNILQFMEHIIIQNISSL